MLKMESTTISVISGALEPLPVREAAVCVWNDLGSGRGAGCKLALDEPNAC